MSSTLSVAALATMAAVPTPTPLSSTPESERIASVLVDWASSMRSGGFEPGFPHVKAALEANATLPAISGSHMQASVGLRTSGTPRGGCDADPERAVSHLFDGLPTAARALVGLFVLVAALVLALFGAQSLRWGAQLGKRRGDPSSRSWLAGGVGGLLGGSIGLSACGRHTSRRADRRAQRRPRSSSACSS